MKILVADDELAIRELLQAVLTDEGYTVVLANNGRQALDVARDEDPDLILIDIMMPILDGREAIRRLFEMELIHMPPIVVMSAGIAFEPDANTDVAFLPKPFNIDDVLDIVEQGLSSSSRHREGEP